MNTIATPGQTVPHSSGPGWSIGSRGQESTVPYPAPRHYMHQRHEYAGGRVVEQENPDHYLTAAVALEQLAARLKARHVPYTIDGLTITYEDVKGHPTELNCTTTLTYRDAS